MMKEFPATYQIHTPTHLDDTTCLQTFVMQRLMKQLCSCFLWQSVPLLSDQNDLCKKPNTVEIPLKDIVCIKALHPALLYAYILKLTQGVSL